MPKKTCTTRPTIQRIRRFCANINLAIKFAICIFVFVITAVNNASGNPTNKNVPVHHFNLPCINCHQQTSDSQSDVGPLNGEINEVCGSIGCHEYKASINHPVGITPARQVPDDMPLNAFLKIDCITCHGANQSKIVSIEPNGNKSLRIPGGFTFCNSCHDGMTGTTAENSHWQFSSMAHLDNLNPNNITSKSDQPFASMLDTETKRCLSCHEEVNARFSSSGDGMQWQGMSNHPIGIDYAQSAGRRSSRYNYPLTDQDAVRLFDGKIGCGSCHSMYSKEKKNLVQSNFKSDLCFQCHNL